MATLPTLPNLPVLTPPDSQMPLSPAAGAAAASLGGLSNTTLGGEGLLSHINIASAVAIILGLILIGAGVLSFSKVQEAVGYAETAALTAA